MCKGVSSMCLESLIKFCPLASVKAKQALISSGALSSLHVSCAGFQLSVGCTRDCNGHAPEWHCEKPHASCPMPYLAHFFQGHGFHIPLSVLFSISQCHFLWTLSLVWAAVVRHAPVRFLCSRSKVYCLHDKSSTVCFSYYSHDSYCLCQLDCELVDVSEMQWVLELSNASNSVCCV